MSPNAGGGGGLRQLIIQQCTLGSNKLWRSYFIYILWRETRGGNPCCLLKLRQMETQRLQMKGVLLDWFVGFFQLVQEIFVLPWLFYTTQYKIVFFSPYTISIHLSPMPGKLGRQSCRGACLVKCVFGPPPRAEKRTGRSLLSFIYAAP
jgi:hypothetical protein